jgi:hypothetical protein
MIYYIVVEVTKRIPIDLMITETNEDIIDVDHFIFFIDVVYKSYMVEKWKRDEVDPYDMVYHSLPKKHFYYPKWNHADIVMLNDSHWRIHPFAAGKEKWICIYWMFLMSYDDCSRARPIGMPYILESTSGTSTLIFSLVWELILIDGTTLLKDQ